MTAKSPWLSWILRYAVTEVADKRHFFHWRYRLYEIIAAGTCLAQVDWLVPPCPNLKSPNFVRHYKGPRTASYQYIWKSNNLKVEKNRTWNHTPSSQILLWILTSAGRGLTWPIRVSRWALIWVIWLTLNCIGYCCEQRRTTIRSHPRETTALIRLNRWLPPRPPVARLQVRLHTSAPHLLSAVELTHFWINLKAMTVVDRIGCDGTAPYSKNMALALVPPIAVTSVALIVVITKVPREHVLDHLPYLHCYLYIEHYWSWNLHSNTFSHFSTCHSKTCTPRQSLCWLPPSSALRLPLPSVPFRQMSSITWTCSWSMLVVHMLTPALIHWETHLLQQ